MDTENEFSNFEKMIVNDYLDSFKEWFFDNYGFDSKYEQAKKDCIEYFKNELDNLLKV